MFDPTSAVEMSRKFIKEQCQATIGFMRSSVLVWLVASSVLFSPVVTIRGCDHDSNPNYDWLWEDLATTLGNMPGDDSVYHGGSLGPYLNYSELTNRLVALNETFPQLVELWSIGQSSQGRELWLVRLTDEQAFYGKRGVLVVGHHHTREAFTVLATVCTLERVLADFITGSSEVLDGLTVEGLMIGSTTVTIRELMTRTELFFLPSLNPDGLDILHLNPWIRKNLNDYDDNEDGNSTPGLVVDLNGDHFISSGELPDELVGGVDLNRNYDFEWNGSGSSFDPGSIVYCGPTPFSEPETQALRDWALQYHHGLNYALSLHTGLSGFIAPWTHSLGVEEEMVELNAIVDQGLASVTVLPNWTPYAYESSGDFVDWLYGSFGVPSYTVELYGGEPYEVTPTSNGLVGVWDYYNPSGNQIVRYSRPVLQSTYLLSLMPRLPTNANTPAFVRFLNQSKWLAGELSVAFDVLDLSYPSVEEQDNYTVQLLHSTDGRTDWNVLYEGTNLTRGTTYIIPQTTVGRGMVRLAVIDGLGGRSVTTLPTRELNRAITYPPLNLTHIEIPTSTSTNHDASEASSEDVSSSAAIVYVLGFAAVKRKRQKKGMGI